MPEPESKSKVAIIVVPIVVALIACLSVIASAIIAKIPISTPSPIVIIITETPVSIFTNPASTPNPTLAFVPPTALPSPLPATAFVSSPTLAAVTCQSSHLGAGKQFNVTLQSNCYYHFNIACNGCVAGQENNYLVYYVGSAIQVTVPEGSVWQYGTEPTAEQFSSDCSASSIDFWSSQLPSFLNVSGIQQLFPCGVR